MSNSQHLEWLMEPAHIGFHNGSTKLPTSQIVILPCCCISSQPYGSHAKPYICAPSSLVDMLCNVTSLSVPVSTWLCKTTSWHRQHPWITSNIAISKDSAEFLCTVETSNCYRYLFNDYFYPSFHSPSLFRIDSIAHPGHGAQCP